MQLLSVLDDRLGSHANLCGDKCGIADMAIFPFVRQFAATDQGWFDAQPLPHLRSWLESHLASPLFGAVMVRLQPWLAGDEPIRFPAD